METAKNLRKLQDGGAANDYDSELAKKGSILPDSNGDEGDDMEQKKLKAHMEPRLSNSVAMLMPPGKERTKMQQSKFGVAISAGMEGNDNYYIKDPVSKDFGGYGLKMSDSAKDGGDRMSLETYLKESNISNAIQELNNEGIEFDRNFIDAHDFNGSLPMNGEKLFMSVMKPKSIMTDSETRDKIMAVLKKNNVISPSAEIVSKIDVEKDANGKQLFVNQAMANPLTEGAINDATSGLTGGKYYNDREGEEPDKKKQNALKDVISGNVKAIMDDPDNKEGKRTSMALMPKTATASEKKNKMMKELLGDNLNPADKKKRDESDIITDKDSKRTVGKDGQVTIESKDGKKLIIQGDDSFEQKLKHKPEGKKEKEKKERKENEENIKDEKGDEVKQVGKKKGRNKTKKK